MSQGLVGSLGGQVSVREGHELHRTTLCTVDEEEEEREEGSIGV